ncbi:MAG: amidase, partial [Gemmatimonadetes bacterium]|nr:amidase [Gemmatimonadota bacterium]
MTRAPLFPLAAAALAAVAIAGPTAAQAFDVVETTIVEAHDAMDDGSLTCRGLVESYLARIAAYDEAGPRLNAIQTVNPRALELADSLDEVWTSGGPRGALHCVPVLLKDQVET